MEQEERILRTAGQSTLTALQAQLERAEAAAQHVVDHNSLAAPLPQKPLPIMQPVSINHPLFPPPPPAPVLCCASTSTTMLCRLWNVAGMLQNSGIWQFDWHAGSFLHGIVQVGCFSMCGRLMPVLNAQGTANIGTAVSMLLPGAADLRLNNGLQQTVSGYGIAQLLQSIGLEVSFQCRIA